MPTPTPTPTITHTLAPFRIPALIPRSNRPLNAETPLQLLAAAFITPTALFFVRNHLPVPDIDPATYRLKIEGVGVREVSPQGEVGEGLACVFGTASAGSPFSAAA